MASSQNYLKFILDQLSELSDISYRVMMGKCWYWNRGRSKREHFEEYKMLP